METKTTTESETALGCHTMPSPPDWAALPRDVLLAIFTHVPQADVLRGAGLVCASWRRVAVHEPLLWQRIDLAADDEDKSDGWGEESAPAGWKAMARAAVDRSAGRCESFRGRADDDLLLYLGDNAPLLRSLHVTSRLFVHDDPFIDGVVKKLPLLERLVLARGCFGKAAVRALLDHCPRLQLLDAAGCRTYTLMGCRLLARCRSRIKDLRLPAKPDSCCDACEAANQRRADEEDE